MWIDHLRVENFKSFRRLDLSLGAVNVVVGANASGKTNLLNVLRFIRDVSESGLANAISLQGGPEFVLNRSANPGEPLLIEFSGDPRLGFMRYPDGDDSDVAYEVNLDHLDYRTLLSFQRSSRDADILEDQARVRITIRGRAIKRSSNQERYELGAQLGDPIVGSTTVRNDRGIISETHDFTQRLPFSGGILFPYLGTSDDRPGELLLERFPRAYHELFGLYDFDPRWAKRSLPAAGKLDLEEDGSNLAICLNRIFDDSQDRRTFMNLVQSFLPFVRDVNVENEADRLQISVAEGPTKKGLFPASLMAGGTVSILLLIATLQFEKWLIAIEEPERNLHPQLVARLMQLVFETSPFKQVILTTHSPEVVKHTPLENLVLIERDKEGASVARRPGNSKQLLLFLTDELGLEDLFVQNMLGI